MNADGLMCRTCGERKPTEAFALRTDGGKVRRRGQCRQCVNARLARNTAANPEAAQARQARYYDGNRDHIRERNRANYEQNREAITARRREGHRRLREKAIAAYGGRCACCGETTYEFLAIDHVNNDGAQHRRDIGKQGGAHFYGWLQTNDFPQDGRFQILCHNCNLAKGFYGTCPHQTVIRRAA